jgi:hypothetical protein
VCVQNNAFDMAGLLDVFLSGGPAWLEMFQA